MKKFVILMFFAMVGCVDGSETRVDFVEEISESEINLVVRNPDPRPDCNPVKCPRPLGPQGPNLKKLF